MYSYLKWVEMPHMLTLTNGSGADVIPCWFWRKLTKRRTWWQGALASWWIYFVAVQWSGRFRWMFFLKSLEGSLIVFQRPSYTAWWLFFTFSTLTFVQVRVHPSLSSKDAFHPFESLVLLGKNCVRCIASSL